MRLRKCLKELLMLSIKFFLILFVSMNLVQFIRLKTHKRSHHLEQLPLCSSETDYLVGKIRVYTPPEDFDAMKSSASSLRSSSDINYTCVNGRWKPVHCTARHRLAIIIPYKDRLSNLNFFMYHMHPFLQKQLLEYQIFVVEQSNDDLFNKGVLMNAAFLEAMHMTRISRSDLQTLNFTSYNFPFDCVMFHDVDLLPENDKIMYSCSMKKPRHLSVAIDKYKYKLLYYKLIGGVLNFKPYHFVQVNGYSNEYWGWGAEDDDMEKRLSAESIGFERPDIKIAHYRMIKHKPRFKNPKRKFFLKYALSRYVQDGLVNLKYRLDYKIQHDLFTHLYVDVGQPPQYIIDYMNNLDTTAVDTLNATDISNRKQKRKKRSNYKKAIKKKQ